MHSTIRRQFTATLYIWVLIVTGAITGCVSPPGSVVGGGDHEGELTSTPEDPMRQLSSEDRESTGVSLASPPATDGEVAGAAATIKAWVEFGADRTPQLNWSRAPKDENSLLFWYLKSATPISEGEQVSGSLNTMIIPARPPWSLKQLEPGYYAGSISGFMRDDVKSNWVIFRVTGKRGSQSVPVESVPQHSMEQATEKMDSDIDLISRALDRYKVDCRIFPTTRQGLTALSSFPQTEPKPQNWKGPYLATVPLDPWGGRYLYEFRTFGLAIPTAPDRTPLEKRVEGYWLRARCAPHTFFFVPKSQFGSLPRGTYLRLPEQATLALQSPKQVWSWCTPPVP